jgi:hypothetical protein
MLKPLRALPAVALVAVLGGCVTLPSGPSVMALPGSGKSFEEFRSDDAMCRRFAYDQVGGQSAEQSANDSAVRSAVVGTVLGAAVGAAVDNSRGAGAGAATGLLMGSMAGAGAAQSSAYGSQRRYDHAYIQCMYAQGDRVPVSGRLSARQYAYPPPQYEPPPPGAPPPPPPGAYPPPR